MSTASLSLLSEMRNAAGAHKSVGLPDAVLKQFEDDSRLNEVIAAAHTEWKGLDRDTTYGMDEDKLIAKIFQGFQHLYPEVTRQPYVPIAARGPWMVSLHGAIVHDSGGYGMLGMGHNPVKQLEAMSEERVMANHMTPSLVHIDFINALKAEIGRSRPQCPYESFICLNSGSEANEMVLRLCDLHAGHVCGNRKIHNLVCEGAFHGRTLAAALITDTSKESYKETKAYIQLASQAYNYVLTVPQNDTEALRKVFARCEEEYCWIQALYLEGVMGEGNPGMKLNPDFYMAARELTMKHDGALCIDSIQAGIRTTGNLSICDYPGFEQLPCPDFEVFSKALNGGQYPMSLVALSPRGASWYRHGVYGNTMTGNPRACAIATATLKMMTPGLRQNIVEMGDYFVAKYEAMMKEMPDCIARVNGTGLLFQVKLDPAVPVTAIDGVEMLLRQRGVNVIHGGTNALRFTPNFDITKKEADLQIHAVKEVLLEKRAQMKTQSKL